MSTRKYIKDIVKICEQVLEDRKITAKNIGPNMTFEEMNFDSLMYIYLITLVEDKYGVKIKNEFFEDFGNKSISELVKQIAR